MDYDGFYDGRQADLEDELEDLMDAASAVANMGGNNSIGLRDWFDLSSRIGDLKDAMEGEAQAYGGSL